MRANPSLLFLLLLALTGCPAVDAGEGSHIHSDNDLWMLDLATEWATGWQDLEFTAMDVDGEPRADLEFEVEVQMPAMGHGSDEEVTFEELGDGLYNIHVHFQMEGAWEVSGTITHGDESDTFAADLDVVAE